MLPLLSMWWVSRHAKINGHELEWASAILHLSADKLDIGIKYLENIILSKCSNFNDCEARQE